MGSSSLSVSVAKKRIVLRGTQLSVDPSAKLTFKSVLRDHKLTYENCDNPSSRTLVEVYLVEMRAYRYYSLSTGILISMKITILFFEKKFPCLMS